MTDNSPDYNNLQERNHQVLNDISQLQTTEQKLYDSLENVSITPEQKQQIIDKINQVSQIRINLYTNLQDMSSYYQENVSAAKTTLGQQKVAIDIIENELNDSKRKLNVLQEQKNNTLRMVEINTYYGDKYTAHKRIMKTVVIICLPLILLAFLANKSILPGNVYALLSGIVLIIGIIILGYQLIDLSNRSNMNWDEYDWNFNPDTAPETAAEPTTSSSSNPWSSTATAACVGSECCDANSSYDSTQNKCILDSNTTEAFTNSVLSKYAYSHKSGARLANTAPKPAFSSSISDEKYSYYAHF